MTKSLLKFIVLSLPTVMVMVSCSTFNDVCGPSLHCNVTAGLLCDAGRCLCTSKNIDRQYKFNLTWDATRGLCVGNNGSACVGTRDAPVPAGMKQVECAKKHSCMQVPKAPFSLGICKEAPSSIRHGGPCSPAGDQTKLEFCDVSRGLFCNGNNICSCSSNRVNTSPDYNLVWNEERGKCVGEIGSGCIIGTKETPVSGEHKTVECVPQAMCTQASGKTPGVGICQKLVGNSVGRLRNDMKTIGLFVFSYFTLYLSF